MPAVLDPRPPMVALLYDIHGNLAALEAVLDDARVQGAERFLLGGDYTLFGPWPAETLNALEALANAEWIRGNGERWTAAPHDAPDDDVVQGAIAACRETLDDGAVQRLATLPGWLERADTLFCHGSPTSDVRSFRLQPAEDEAELLSGVSHPRLVFGHTHLPFARRSSGGIELVNPGSVGMPFDGDPRAAYALVHHDGRVEHRRAAYDHAACAAALRERFEGTWVGTVARRIEQATFQPA